MLEIFFGYETKRTDNKEANEELKKRNCLYIITAHPNINREMGLSGRSFTTIVVIITTSLQLKYQTVGLNHMNTNIVLIEYINHIPLTPFILV